MPLDVLKEVLAAGGGCAVADGLLNPLETMKVKLQLQPESPRIYDGMLGGLSKAVAEDGLLQGLWLPGLAATFIRSFTYVGFRIGLYPTVKKAVQAKSDGRDTLAVKILSGCFTGAIGSALFCPVDVVRLRMQADSGTLGPDGVLVSGLRRGLPPRYDSTLSAFSSIVRQEGLTKGLYRGAGPTVLRAAVLSGSQLASYDGLKQVLKGPGSSLPLPPALREEGPVLHSCCSLTSGLIAQTCIQPFDTTRSVIMAGHLPIGESLRRHGPFFLLRGYLTACCRQGPIMLIQMPVVEQLRLLLDLEPF